MHGSKYGFQALAEVCPLKILFPEHVVFEVQNLSYLQVGSSRTGAMISNVYSRIES